MDSPPPPPTRMLVKNQAQCLTCHVVVESVRGLQECSCGRLGVDGGLGETRRVWSGPYREMSWWDVGCAVGAAGAGAGVGEERKRAVREDDVNFVLVLLRRDILTWLDEHYITTARADVVPLFGPRLAGPEDKEKALVWALGRAPLTWGAELKGVLDELIEREGMVKLKQMVMATIVNC
jgi:hypothetical protein